MSEGILKFNLPEEEHEFKTATQARQLYCALWEVDSQLRALVKYDEGINGYAEQKIQEIRENIPYYLLEE